MCNILSYLVPYFLFSYFRVFFVPLHLFTVVLKNRIRIIHCVHVFIYNVVSRLLCRYSVYFDVVQTMGCDKLKSFHIMYGDAKCLHVLIRS